MDNLFPITVDYSKSLAEMIKAGNYEWVNSSILEDHFPIKGKGQVEFSIELIHYGKCMYSEQIMRDLDSRGLRPATLPELLAFGAAYPGEQRKYYIAALGSSWLYCRVYRYAAYLYRWGSRRALGLGLCACGWGGSFRFAAVCN